MSEENEHRVRALFNEALEITDLAQREAFLVRIGAEDQPLRQKLEQLLLAFAAARGFLANPPPRSIPHADGLVATVIAQPGTRISRYKLLQQLGEGGCGIVFLAEQEEPVRRQVALKVIKLGMDTKSIIARFEAERQALAIMDHPGIARIFDAGSTETGRPYFVMELVHGIKITEYCDQKNLTTPARLNLFIQVCKAVQHAHQKGIIHRDLKPSNILVSADDGQPTPKIIDFGIAKATESRLTDQTVFTALEQFIGTPAYVSPEQATMTNLDIDTRSDIYSLGVLLYELLTGKTPFDPKQLAEGGLDAMRRIIREDEPQRPSTRLRALPGEELTTTAKRRQTDVPRLLSVLTGDLDWVVMKCLEKDRTRRYETANGLAMDLQHYLAEEPVTARPPSAVYQLSKLVRRHKVTFAAAGAILVVLVSGIVISSLEAARARSSEREQRRLRNAADFKLYAGDMYRANEFIRSGYLGRARDLLEQYRPKPGDARQPDFRGWEWRYMWPRCQSEARFQLTVTPNAEAVCSLAVSPDGKWLGIGEDGEGVLSIWDLEGRKEVAHPATGNQRVLVTFSPGQALLAYAGSDSLAANPSNSWVRFWTPDASQCPPELPLDGPCNGLAFAPDGRTLMTATAGQAGKITLWQMPEGTLRTNWSASQRDYTPPDARAAFTLSPDGNLAAYISNDQKEVRVIDLATGGQLLKVQIQTNEEEVVRSMGFSPDSKVLALAPGFTASPVRLYEIATGREIKRLQGHRGAITALVFGNDGNTLIGGSGDSTLCIWNLADPEATAQPQHLRGHRDDVWTVAWLPGQHALVSGSKSGEVNVWDLGHVTNPPSSFTLPARVARWGFTTNGQAIVTLEMSGRCAQWTGPDFQQSQTLIQVASNLGGSDADAWFSPDRRFIAVKFPKSSLIRVFDLIRQMPTVDLPGAGESEFAMRFLPNGKNLVVIREDGSFHEWNLATRREVNSWQGAARLEAGDISPDGRWYATFGYDSAASLYDLVARRELFPKLETRRAQGAAYSPDGKLFAVVGLAGKNKLWETAAWREFVSLKLPIAHGFSVVFSPDQKRLAVGGGWNDAMVLCDVESGLAVLGLAGQGSMFEAPEFSPDGTTLGALASGSGILHFWRAPSWEEIGAAEKPRPDLR